MIPVITLVITLLAQPDPLGGTSLSREAPVQLYDEGTKLGQVTRINCSGSGITCTRSGTSVGTGTITVSGGGGGSVTGDGASGIDVTADVVGCIPASGVQNGCITTTAQTLEGTKTFIQWIEAPGVRSLNGGYLLLEGSQPGASTNTDFYLFTKNARSDGYLLTLNNQFDPKFSFDWNGNLAMSGNLQFYNLLYANTTVAFVTASAANNVNAAMVFHTTERRDAGGDLAEFTDGDRLLVRYGTNGEVYAGTQESRASFIDNSGASGHTSLTCLENDYVTIIGNLPENYYGHHGAVTFANAHPNPAFIAGFFNVQTSSATDFKMGINYQGGLVPYFAATNLADFAPCGNYDLAPLDAGIIGTDAGAGWDGTLMRAADSHYWYQCYIPTGNIGTWQQIALASQTIASHGVSQALESGTSTFVAGTKSITFTQAFGGTPTCVCADASGSVLACSRGTVSSSGVTFFGTLTDPFDWICVGAK